MFRWIKCAMVKNCIDNLITTAIFVMVKIKEVFLCG